MGAALAVTLVTGVDYVIRAMRMSKPEDKPAEAAISRGGDPPHASQVSAPDEPDRETRDRIRPVPRGQKPPDG